MPTVLVVDDEPLITSIIEEMLALLDNDVYTASNFCEGEEILSDAEDIDVIILDRNLPDTDGVSGFLKLVQKYSNLKCILISGNLEDIPEDINSYIENGQLVLCGKPFNFDYLNACIKKLTGISAYNQE